MNSTFSLNQQQIKNYSYSIEFPSSFFNCYELKIFIRLLLSIKEKWKNLYFLVLYNIENQCNNNKESNTKLFNLKFSLAPKSIHNFDIEFYYL